MLRGAATSRPQQGGWIFRRGNLADHHFDHPVRFHVLSLRSLPTARPGETMSLCRRATVNWRARRRVAALSIRLSSDVAERQRGNGGCQTPLRGPELPPSCRDRFASLQRFASDWRIKEAGMSPPSRTDLPSADGSRWSYDAHSCCSRSRLEPRSPRRLWVLRSRWAGRSAPSSWAHRLSLQGFSRRLSFSDSHPFTDMSKHVVESSSRQNRQQGSGPQTYLGRH
jgi:hypothetical protein